MSRRQLSITDLARAYSGADADPFDGDVGSDDLRCDSRGALHEQEEPDLFPGVCRTCGHEVEVVE